jgi:hypothetical protein
MMRAVAPEASSSMKVCTGILRADSTYKAAAQARDDAEFELKCNEWDKYMGRLEAEAQPKTEASPVAHRPTHLGVCSYGVWLISLARMGLAGETIKANAMWYRRSKKLLQRPSVLVRRRPTQTFPLELFKPFPSPALRAAT